MFAAAGQNLTTAWMCAMNGYFKTVRTCLEKQVAPAEPVALAAWANPKRENQGKCLPLCSGAKREIQGKCLPLCPGLWGH